MYCCNCGKENEQGAAFCTACGSSLLGAPINPIQDQKPKKKNVPAIILGALSVMLAVILTFLLIGVFEIREAVPPVPPSKSIGACADATANSGGGDITPSTIVREPLPEGSVNETGYYTDESGLLSNESELLPGLVYFYDKTGVQPYVYLIKSINGSTDTPAFDDLQAFAESKYTELFTDDAHLLLVLFENDYSYRYWFTVGPKAKTVIDYEAGNILGDYIDWYYGDMSLSYQEFLSKVFKKTADRIMSVTAQAD